ncbi:MAG: DCC1-like thiol-disulfide oxidoreductase family protein [Verrucomicrobiota bacterium JB022]|nr:DCC1-like thiol-disulfide oxidoreductase family protein [Verrucomicrobiota bacterium JB022]
MSHPVLLFDGDCNFCRAAVHWLVQHDPAGHLHYAPLQSEPGRQLLREHDIDEDYIKSVVLIEPQHAHFKSDAVLRALSYCKQPWRTLRRLRFVPKALRDIPYEGVSQNRPTLSRAVGTIDHTYVPAPEVRNRFLAY